MSPPRWHRHHHHHHHREGCGPGGHRHRPYALHRRLFVWFGVTIALTLLLVGWLFDSVGHTRAHMFMGLGLSGLILWLATGAIARRLIRPLGQVARVARDIGDGNLSSRVTLRRHNPGEISALAEAVNDMAARIEKQLSDQRALLAAVSHEIRTPLGHMKVLTELARGGDLGRLTELEREIDEVDTLVDQLLASSRLEFESFDRRPLEAGALCARAMERADVDASLLDVDTDDALLQGDPTLLSRAVGNLLENALRHGDAIAAVRVQADLEHVRITVEDRGPGFAPEDLERAFEQFYRGERSTASGRGSLGLGLALVRRIAEAHGGTVRAANYDHGARLTIELPRAIPSATAIE